MRVCVHVEQRGDERSPQRGRVPGSSQQGRVRVCGGGPARGGARAQRTDGAAAASARQAGAGGRSRRAARAGTGGYHTRPIVAAVEQIIR